MTRPPPPPDLFERFGLSPESDVATITEVLRERAEAADVDERPAIRAAWQALTRRADERVVLALGALAPPEPHGPPPPALAPPAALTLALDDLVALPRLSRHLPPASADERALDVPRVMPPGPTGSRKEGS